MTHTKSVSNQAAADAVAKGLAAANKNLPSWLFYDEEGDRIFQQIMRMPEYYPTRCEYDILQQYKDELLTFFNDHNNTFRLVELGAGDGLKTEILLRHFLDSKAHFSYYPVDISDNALGMLSERLTSTFPDLKVIPQNKSYDDALAALRDSEKKVILFMGANIGNFTVQEAVQFLRKLALRMHKDDLLLIGFDLKKHPRVIQEAYDDPRGLTAEFNLNILRRLNRELGANFDTDNFTHYPFYDPETGTTKSFLISMADQSVHFEALGRTVRFAAWETIQTEVSQKYDVRLIEKITALSDLQIVHTFTNADNYFADVLLRGR